MMRTRTGATSTAATRATEPEIIAGIASAEGRFPKYRIVSDAASGRLSLGCRSGVLLAALALGAAAGSWLVRPPRRG